MQPPTKKAPPAPHLDKDWEDWDVLVLLWISSSTISRFPAYWHQSGVQVPEFAGNKETGLRVWTGASVSPRASGRRLPEVLSCGPGTAVWAPQHGPGLFPPGFSPHRTSNKLCCRNREPPRDPELLLWAVLGSGGVARGATSLSLNRYSKFLTPGACSFTPSLTTAHCDHQSKQPLPGTEHPPPAQKTDGFSFTEAQGSLSPAHTWSSTSQPPPFIWGTVKK